MNRSCASTLTSISGVADELSIGSMRLKNVAFLVFPDDQPPIQSSGARLTRTYRNTGGRVDGESAADAPANARATTGAVAVD